MRKFGGLRKLLPYTHWTFFCGSAALAGLVPFAGFWSKDEILAAAHEAAGGEHFAALYYILFIVGVITAGLTAFYTFRAYFMTFWGEEKIPVEAGDHAHESPMVMVVPLAILAFGAVFTGLVFGPLTGGVPNLLYYYWMEQPSFEVLHMEHHEHALNYSLMLLSTVVAFGGVGLAWLMYVQQPKLAETMAKVGAIPHALSRNRFFIDEIYGILIIKPLRFIAKVCRLFDTYVLDQVVDLVGKLPSIIGYLFSPIQNGLVQFYALLMILGLAGFLISMLLRL